LLADMDGPITKPCGLERAWANGGSADVRTRRRARGLLIALRAAQMLKNSGAKS
jgi:hypothetical protein